MKDDLKPGTLALVVKAGNPANVGKLVEVIDDLGWKEKGETFMHDGSPFQMCEAGHAYYVTSLTSNLLINTRLGKTNSHTSGCTLRHCLMPLPRKGEDAAMRQAQREPEATA